MPDARLVGDVGGAAAYLRALPTSNGKVGVIGYCSGGRQSVLAACNLDLDAAVDCYGAFVTGTPPEGFPLQVTNLVDQLPEPARPLLGLFGNEDKYPSPEQVDELEAAAQGQRQDLRVPPLRQRRPRRSSPSTGRRTGSRRPTTAGNASSRFYATNLGDGLTCAPTPPMQTRR